MRVPGLHKLVKHHGRRQQGRHRRGRPVSESRWQLVGGVAAVVTLAAVWNAPLPDRPATGGYNASVPAAVDPFIEDETLAEFVDPEQLEAVPVGPGRVAKPVQMVLAGAPVIRTLGESGIPDVAVRAYKQAEARLAVSDPGCGVPWTLLAAIGRVESNHGRFGGAQLRNDGSATRRIRGIPLDGRPNVALIRDTDGGALDGDTVYDRAVGPMQFIPSTWRAVNADGNGDGFGDPNNMFDAAQGAAQYLCTGTSNLRDPGRAAQAVRRYNNAASYVRVVLDLARMYQSGRVVALPSTGDALLDEPTDPPAARPWPTDPPAARPWTVDPPAARPVDPPAARPTDPQPDVTALAKPAPVQRPKPSAPPQAVSPPRTTPPQPQPTTTPTAPKPTQTPPSTPTRPSDPTTIPAPTEPAPTEPDTSQPSKPRPSAPQPSQPKATKPKPSEPEPKPSEPEPSESGSPTPAPSATPSPAPSADRTPAQKPTTAAIGWAPAMRQVVGRALARPTCPQTPNEAGQPRTPRQPIQPSTPCPDDSATPPPSRDDKNRKQCTPQTACKPPTPRR